MENGSDPLVEDEFVFSPDDIVDIHIPVPFIKWGLDKSEEALTIPLRATVELGGQIIENVDVSDHVHLFVYASDDPSIALSVDNGKFNVVSEGVANLSVSLMDSDISASVEIRVVSSLPFNAVTGGAFFGDEKRLWAWGQSGTTYLRGMLGSGSLVGRKYPVPVYHSVENVSFISAGGSHSLALTANGEVWGAGRERYFQPSGGYDDYVTPIKVDTQEAIEPIKSVEAGHSSSYIIDANGSLWAWGRNYSGRLGVGHSNQVDSATRIDFPITVGEVVQISAASSHALALDSLGRVWSWGSNYSGQLGDDTYTDRDAPVLVDFPSLSDGASIVYVATGGSHSIALDSQGAVWAWGDGTSGQLGEGYILDRQSRYPVKVAFPDDVNVAEINSNGGDINVALDSAGRAWIWGKYSYNEEEVYPQPEIIQVGNADIPLQRVRAGRNALYLMDYSGRVWQLGWNGEHFEDHQYYYDPVSVLRPLQADLIINEATETFVVSDESYMWIAFDVVSAGNYAVSIESPVDMQARVYDDSGNFGHFLNCEQPFSFSLQEGKHYLLVRGFDSEEEYSAPVEVSIETIVETMPALEGSECGADDHLEPPAV